MGPVGNILPIIPLYVTNGIFQILYLSCACTVLYIWEVEEIIMYQGSDPSGNLISFQSYPIGGAPDGGLPGYGAFEEDPSHGRPPSGGVHNGRGFPSGGHPGTQPQGPNGP